MDAPSLQIGHQIGLGDYTPLTPVSLLPAGYQIDAYALWRSQKSEPGFPGSLRASRWGALLFSFEHDLSENRFPLFRIMLWGLQDTRYYDAGSSTVSMTWMTPFD
jgi:hypothetical protein